jgi:hypothetical protein
LRFGADLSLGADVMASLHVAPVSSYQTNSIVRQRFADADVAPFRRRLLSGMPAGSMPVRHIGPGDDAVLWKHTRAVSVVS